MMAFFGVIAIAMAAQLVVCNDSNVAASHYMGDHFKSQLDWVFCKLDKHHKGNEEAYKNEIVNDMRKRKLRSLLKDLDIQFADFVKEMLELRALITSDRSCEGYDHPDSVAALEPQASLDEFYSLIPFMNDSLIALSEKIVEWEADGKITTLTDEEPAKWFAAMGFAKETLSNVSLDKVKAKLNSIMADGKALKKLMYRYATPFLLKSPKTTVEQLAWLYIFASAVESNPNMEKNAVADFNSMRPGKGEELVEELKNFASETEDSKLYPFSMKGWKYASYIFPMTKAYLVGLKVVCSMLQLGLSEIRTTLDNDSLHKPLSISEHLTQGGFNIYDTDEERNEAVDRIYDILANSAPFAAVCSIMNEFRVPPRYTPADSGS